MQSNPLSRHKSCIPVSRLSCSLASEKHYSPQAPFHILDAVVMFSWLLFYHIIPKFVSLCYVHLYLVCYIKCCQFILTFKCSSLENVWFLSGNPVHLEAVVCPRSYVIPEILSFFFFYVYRKQIQTANSLATQSPRRLRTSFAALSLLGLCGLCVKCCSVAPV